MTGAAFLFAHLLSSGLFYIIATECKFGKTRN
jgi:hypothetical protein